MMFNSKILKPLKCFHFKFNDISMNINAILSKYVFTSKLGPEINTTELVSSESKFHIYGSK